MTSETGSILEMRSKMGQPLSWGTIAGGMLLMLYISYHFGFSRGHTHGSEQPVEIAVEPQELQRLKAENAQLKQHVMAIEQQFEIVEAAKKNLEQYLQIVEKNNTEMTQDLAIVHSVKKTQPAKAALKIAHFQLFPTEHPQTFRYMLLLSREALGAYASRGTVSMTIQGRVGAKLIFLPVKYEDAVQVNGLAFQCQDFQELSGELSLPAQFEPMEVLFKLRTDQGEELPQQVFPWQIV